MTRQRDLVLVDFVKVLEVHIYKLTDFTGEPTETEEMRPEWFSFDEIPFSQMWSDDEHWFPLFYKSIQSSIIIPNV